MKILVTRRNVLSCTTAIGDEIAERTSWAVCCFLRVALTAAQHCLVGVGKGKLPISLLK